MKTLAKATICLLASFGLWISLAHAHTQLSSSIPANEAVVETAPEEVVLSFSEPVRLTAVSLESVDMSHSLEVDAAEPAEEFTVALPALMAGKHVIQWRVLSQDTHVMTGEIQFTVSP